MKKIAMLTLAATLSLGSCATTGGVTPDTIQSAVISVQQGVGKACGFIINTRTTNVTAILAFLLPSYASAEAAVVAAIAQICAAVAPLRAGKRLGGAAPPTVGGVVIHGRFVL